MFELRDVDVVVGDTIHVGIVDLESAFGAFLQDGVAANDEGIVEFGTDDMPFAADGVGKQMPQRIVARRICHSHGGMHDGRHDVIVGGAVIILPWGLSRYVDNEGHHDLMS